VAVVSNASVITSRVPSELKKEMSRVKVNWSEYIRNAIKVKLEEHRMKVASAKIEEIMKRAKEVPSEELVSWIRESRER